MRLSEVGSATPLFFSEGREVTNQGVISELNPSLAMVYDKEDHEEEERGESHVAGLDCWSEVRATLKRPAGFFARSQRHR